MAKYVYTKEITIFIFSPLMIMTKPQNLPPPFANLLKGAQDGTDFIKKVYEGKSPILPEVLMFTAPYRLCDGDCDDSREASNIQFNFPLFVGNKAKTAYKEIYSRDNRLVHSNKPNAPFRSKSTRILKTTTPCIIITVKAIEASTKPCSTVPPVVCNITRTCPKLYPGSCIKRKKKMNKESSTFKVINSTYT